MVRPSPFDDIRTNIKKVVATALPFSVGALPVLGSTLTCLPPVLENDLASWREVCWGWGKKKKEEDD